MRIARIVPFLLAALLVSCATGEQRLSRTLNQKGTNAAPIVAPPTFDEPSEALCSLYLIGCPRCKARQFLVPLRILTTGGTTTANGHLIERSLYFMCSKRKCKNVIITHDQVSVEPTRAVRVR